MMITDKDIMEAMDYLDNVPIEADRYKANDAMLKMLSSGLNRIADKIHALKTHVHRAKEEG